jgi:hypothetical protein
MAYLREKEVAAERTNTVVFKVSAVLAFGVCHPR